MSNDNQAPSGRNRRNGSLKFELVERLVESVFKVIWPPATVWRMVVCANDDLEWKHRIFIAMNDWIYILQDYGLNFERFKPCNKLENRIIRRQENVQICRLRRLFGFWITVWTFKAFEWREIRFGIRIICRPNFNDSRECLKSLEDVGKRATVESRWRAHEKWGSSGCWIRFSGLTIVMANSCRTAGCLLVTITIFHYYHYYRVQVAGHRKCYEWWMELGVCQGHAEESAPIN